LATKHHSKPAKNEILPLNHFLGLNSWSRA
jgi:hypothetical protein